MPSFKSTTRTYDAEGHRVRRDSDTRHRIVTETVTVAHHGDGSRTSTVTRHETTRVVPCCYCGSTEYTHNAGLCGGP